MAVHIEILIEEQNIISLRRAYVMDVHGSVQLQLSSRESSVAVKPNPYKTEFLDELEAYTAHLYQYSPSPEGIWQSYVKEQAFEVPPKLRLLWTDSGNSVAAYLNDEPWAFIDEHTRKSYSKGVLDPQSFNAWYQKLHRRTKNCWDENVFQKTFFPDTA